jgi:hypothetical protein
MIEWLIDRVHVGTSNRGVLREVLRRIHPDGRRSRALRGKRHKLLRRALKRHADNGALYARVTRGNL